MAGNAAALPRARPASRLQSADSCSSAARRRDRPRHRARRSSARMRRAVIDQIASGAAHMPRGAGTLPVDCRRRVGNPEIKYSRTLSGIGIGRPCRRRRFKAALNCQNSISVCDLMTSGSVAGRLRMPSRMPEIGSVVTAKVSGAGWSKGSRAGHPGASRCSDRRTRRWRTADAYRRYRHPAASNTLRWRSSSLKPR